MYFFFSLLPKNLCSFLFGKIAFCRLPKWLLQPLIAWYCRHYAVSTEEIELPLEAYPSLGAFFIRNLKSGVRPLGSGLLSPVDGRLTSHGPIASGMLLQVKGKYYGLSDLVRDRELCKKFSNGYYLTIYLAPGDYHHIHSPMSGRIFGSLYIPGTLWPVNSWSTAHIDHLFCRNERLLTLLQQGEQGPAVGVMMVGATNVGSIATSYSSFRSNSWQRIIGRRKEVQWQPLDPPQSISAGERLATFRLGSTVILLFQQGQFTPGSACSAGPVRYGSSLGRLAVGNT
jgi:phosphatidylserine decarboxylase